MKEREGWYLKLIILFNLFIICILLVGCSNTEDIQQLGRDKDIEFNEGSEMKFTSISEKKIIDVAKLCRVWGVVKYHHPDVISGEINWDYELFRVMPSVLEEDADVNLVILDWINSLNKEVKIGYMDEKNLIQLTPSTDWCKDEEYLGEDLSVQLLKLLNTNISKRENGYTSFMEDSPYQYMENEKPYPHMKLDDTGYRLLSLFRYWNIIEYYYPYKDIIGEDWNEVLVEFIPKFIGGSDYETYLKTIAELTTKIHDSHAYLIDKKGDDISQYFGMYRIPVNFIEIEDQIVINKIIYPCGLKIGDIILKVGNTEIDELLNSRRKYISQSREDTAPLMFRELLRTPQKKTDVTLIRDGKTINLRIKGNQKDIDVKVDTKSQEMENGEIYYINVGLLEDGQIDEIMKQYWDTKGLILDLRNYPSTRKDFIAYVLAEYLIPEEKQFMKASFPNREIPGEFYYSDPYYSGKLKKEKDKTLKSASYDGKLVILIDEHTMSQGETTTMSLMNTEDSTVLGRVTAGANGDVRPFKLPGNITTTISGLGIFYPDNGQIQRIGIKPDIYMDPTLEGIREGRDEFIEKAIEIIKESY